MTSTLENVDGRLRDLEEEMTELREFQEKERERKALEYAMYEGELEEITGTLGDVRSPASAAECWPTLAELPLTRPRVRHADGGRAQPDDKFV
jgi:hypothetical protein